MSTTPTVPANDPWVGPNLSTPPVTPGLDGGCAPARFLDIVENFVVFQETRDGSRKVVGEYHQLPGVTRAIAAVEQIQQNQGRPGVFWHTQGSGTSLSMAFFAEKVLRTLGNNWSFVVVTDRGELDRQISGTFASIHALGALAAGPHDRVTHENSLCQIIKPSQDRTVQEAQIS